MGFASVAGNRWALLAAAVAVGIVLPHVLTRSYLDVMVLAGLYGIAGLGVGLLLGQCGIVNLAQAFFFGVGGYSSAYLSVNMGLPPVAGILAGIAISAAIALAVGWPILSLTGFYLAIATLAVGLIGTVMFHELDWLTGGALGIGGIPPLGIGGFVLSTPQAYFWFVWAVFLGLLVLSQNLTEGRPGLAMRAMRDAAPAAEVLGVDLHQLKTQMFVFSAVLGALAGSLFAHYVSFVSVESFTTHRTIIFLLIPVIAGMTSVWGIVIGALFVALVPELLSGLGEAHQMLFGLTLILIVMLLPQGLSGLPALILKRRRA